MQRKMMKKVFGIFCAVALTVTGIPSPLKAGAVVQGGVEINDNTTAMSADGYSFDHAYVKPGDTLKVLHTQDGVREEVTENVQWTVKKVVSGQEDNKVVYETVKSEQKPSLNITEEYLESVIYGEIGGAKLTIYCSKTPVIYINSETNYYDVTKEYTEEESTTIKLVGNDTYQDENYWYDGTGQVKLRGNSTAYRPKRPFKLKLSQKADLLGLGAEKETDGTSKSYASKHWVLLANDIDHSLIRNKLLYDFSGDIGTEFYFKSTNVTLIYNGQYEGVYQLCEHRRVDPGRIDITDWTGIGEDAADTIGTAVAAENGWDKATKKEFIGELETIMASDYSWIDEKKVTMASQTYNFGDYGITLPDTTGGFLAEMDFYSIGDDTLASIATNYKQPLYFSAPEPGEDAATDTEKREIVESFKNTSLYQYAKTYTQTFEYALHSDDFFFDNDAQKYYTEREGSIRKQWKDARYATAVYSDKENDGKHYSELFDMDSLVNNFLFCEYAMNWDSMKNSFFFYKDTNELAKFGPQWDFDWCWGNINMYNINTNYPTSWQTTIDKFTEEQYYQTVQWNRMLIRDPYFLTQAYEKYQEIRPIIENMIKKDGLIEQYADYLREAGAANDARWSYTYNREYSGATAQNFEDSVASIQSFLDKRVKWLDKQFASVSTLVDSLGYYKTSDDIFLSGKVEGDKVVLTAETKNSSAAKIRFQMNGTTCVTADVKDGRASVSVGRSEWKASGLNTVIANEMDGNGDYLYLAAASKTGNYNVVKSDYIAFDLTKPETMEKERPAGFEDTDSKNDGTGTVQNPSTPSGGTNNSIDTPSDSQRGKVVKVTVKAANQKAGTKTVYVKKGGKVKLAADITGTGGQFDKKLTWKSSKPAVASVSSKGVVKTKKTGKTKITVTSVSDKTKKATITIRVSKKAKPNKKLSLKTKSKSLAKGKTYTVAIKTMTKGTTDAVIYKSLKKSIATVDQYGLVTAKKKGEATITVKCGKKKVKLKVKVKK